MSENQKLWLTNGLVAGLLLLGLLAWMFWPQPEPEIIVLEPDPACDLRAGPCELRAPDGERIRFGIQPRDIPVAKTLKLSVELDGTPADDVDVDINGVDMDMGLRPYPLKSRDGKHFTGPGGLNYCSRGIMEWEARVRVDQGNRRIIAPFRFITEAPDPALAPNTETSQ